MGTYQHTGASILRDPQGQVLGSPGEVFDHPFTAVQEASLEAAGAIVVLEPSPPPTPLVTLRRQRSIGVDPELVTKDCE